MIFIKFECCKRDCLFERSSIDVFNGNSSSFSNNAIEISKDGRFDEEEFKDESLVLSDEVFRNSGGKQSEVMLLKDNRERLEEVDKDESSDELFKRS